MLYCTCSEIFVLYCTNQTSVSDAINWVTFNKHCINLKQTSTVYETDKATFATLCKKMNSQQGEW